MPHCVRVDRREPSDRTAPRLVRSSNTDVAYRLLGESGPIVLLLQPFWFGVDDVCVEPRTFGPQLLDGHRIIVHDRRGTGASDRRPDKVSLADQIGDLLAILDELAVERVQVVAMTESAPLAVQFAATHPGRVAGLVLVDPHLRPRLGPGSSMLLHTLHSRPRVGLKAFARSLVDADEAAEVLADGMAHRMDAATAARLYEAFLQADAMAAATSVQARTLLVFGVHDRMVVDEETHELRSRFRNAELGLVNGTPGTSEATREAWVQMQDFLRMCTNGSAPTDDVATRSCPATVPVHSPNSAPIMPRFGDYVPEGMAVRPRHASPPRSPQAIQPTIPVRRVPPGQVAREAVEMNRKAMDHVLLGEIEEALVAFQKAMEIAPEYEEAAINHRELRGRLAQQRVAQWQTQQAEERVFEAERRAADRSARQTKRKGVARWLSFGQGSG